MIPKVQLSSIGCTEGWTTISNVKPSDSEVAGNQHGAPINVVQPSDFVGGANNNRLKLMLDTHKCSVPQ